MKVVSFPKDATVVEGDEAELNRLEKIALTFETKNPSVKLLLIQGRWFIFMLQKDGEQK